MEMSSLKKQNLANGFVESKKSDHPDSCYATYLLSPRPLSPDKLVVHDVPPNRNPVLFPWPFPLNDGLKLFLNVKVVKVFFLSCNSIAVTRILAFFIFLNTFILRRALAWN